MKRFDETRREILRDPAEAAEYLNTVFEQGDRRMFMVALRHVAEAQGGLSKISRKAKLNRAHLYKMLSEHGNPEIESLETILETFGLRFYVGVRDRRPLRKAA